MLPICFWLILQIQNNKMEIINAHVHMVEIEKAISDDTAAMLSENPVYHDLGAMVELMAPENLIKQMDEANIDKSVLYAVDAPIVYSSNEYVSSLVKKYPERLIGFASVNPLRENAVAILENAIKNLGLRGCKFHPPLQNFYPNGKKVFPIYEKLAELGVPVVFHVGSTPFGGMAKLDQANPILLDEVATAFPKLKIMLTHLGTLWSNEAFMVVEKHPNVYIDTAAYLYEIPQLLTSDLITRLGENKIIFGTDYPTPFGNDKHKMKNFVDCIKNLPLSDKQKENIFSKNFYSLFV